MNTLRIFNFILIMLMLPALVFGQVREEVANIGTDNQQTSFGPTYEGTLSLLTIYHFETLFLADEINLTTEGELKAIEFYVTGGVDLDLLDSFGLYLKTTNETSLSNGSISNPGGEGYIQIDGSFSLLGLSLTGGDIVRFELDEGFLIDQGDNIALHTRQNIPVGASLGENYYASNADNLMRAGTTTLTGTPTMQVRDVRPNVRLEFETEFDVSASNSVITAQRPQILADGNSTTLVSLQVRTGTGENVNSGGGQR